MALLLQAGTLGHLVPYTCCLAAIRPLRLPDAHDLALSTHLGLLELLATLHGIESLSLMLLARSDSCTSAQARAGACLHSRVLGVLPPVRCQASVLLDSRGDPPAADSLLVLERGREGSRRAPRSLGSSPRSCTAAGSLVLGSLVFVDIISCEAPGRHVISIPHALLDSCLQVRRSHKSNALH